MVDTLPNIDLLSQAHYIDPFPDYVKLREEYPVCQLEPYGFWVVSRFKDVQYVLKRHDIFSSAAYKDVFQPCWVADEFKRDRFISWQDPPEHTKYRSIVNKAFVSKKINDLVPLMKETAFTLVNNLKQKGSVEFTEDFSYPYLAKINGQIIGTSDKQSLPELRRWIEFDEKTSLTRPSDEYIKEFEAVVRKQNDYFMEAIEDRRAHLQNDVVSILVNSKVDGVGLSDKMLCDASALFVGGGFQTSAHMLNNMIMILSKYPEIFEKLSRSPGLIPGFIEELLRYSPTAHAILRQSVEEVTVANVSIPKDSLVLVVLASANRDASQFENPDVFDMSRTHAKRHLSYGYGIHTCIGEALGRLEIKIALETLLGSVSRISCPVDDQLTWIESLFLRGVSELPVEFQWAS